MNGPTGGWIMFGALLMASPALYAALVVGSLSMETALIRFAIALFVSWAGLRFVASLLAGTSEVAGPLELTTGSAAEDGSEPRA